MTAKLRWLAAALLCALLAGSLTVSNAALAGDGDAGLQKIRADAAYWTRKGRGDKAATLWRVLLEADPINREALVALCLWEASQGHQEEALRLYKRLADAHPEFKGLEQLRQTLELGDRFPKLLAEARAFAKAGKVDEALAKFREAFGKAPPAGLVGREYYQLLGSTKDGWKEAREGLQRLYSASPKDDLAALALAKHLTYREESRREGIERLKALADNPKVAVAVREEAQRAWKQALEWLDVKVPDKPLYKEFETKVGQDPALRKRFDVEPPVAVPKFQNKAVRAAFALLHAGKVDEAAEAFKAELKKRPKSLAALVGLGSVELARGKGHFGQAQEIFEKVKKRSRGQPRYWKRSLRTATFFGLLEAAEVAADAGDVAQANALIANALAIAVDERRHAYFLLGTLHLRGGRYDAAAEAFAKVLADDPKHLEALRGQIQVLVALHKLDEAIALDAKVVEIDPKKGYDVKKLKSEAKRSEAMIAAAKGDQARAMALLNEALALDPENGAAHLDRAYAHAALLDLPAAYAELDSLQADDPKTVAAKRRSLLPSVHLARALLLEREGRFAEAQQSLDKVGEKAMDESAQQLGRRLQIRADVRRAVRSRGRDPQASLHEPFLTLIPATAAEPELGMVVASGLSDLECHGPALTMGQRLLKLPSQDAIGLRIQYAQLLARATRLKEATELLDDLQFDKGYSPRHAKAVSELRLGIAVRQADASREEGDLAKAWATLEPVLRDHPDRPEVLAAMARLSQASGRYDLALKSYEKMLKTDPQDVDLWVGAIEAAVALKEEVKVRRLVKDGLQRFPKSDRMHLAAGRAEAQFGDDDKAAPLLRKGLALQLAAASRPGAGKEPKDSTPSSEIGPPPDPARDLAVHQQIRAELASHDVKYAPLVSVEPRLRFRDGQAGLGKVLDLGTDLGGRVFVDSKTWVALQVSTVSLDAGALDLGTEAVRSQFGQLGTTALANSNLMMEQAALGTSLALEAAHRGLGLRLGTTPLGFALATGVGKLGYNGNFGRAALSIDLHREVVTDSLLSYAGRVDPVTGQAWGQALANGGRATIKLEARNLLWFFSGGGDMVSGTHLPTNGRANVGAGLRVRFADGASSRFTSGFTAVGLWNSKNLRYFSYGHGGYFSPQGFFHLAVPIDWNLTTAGTSVNLGADFGVNFLRESAIDYYPLDNSLQVVSGGVGAAAGTTAGSYPNKSTIGPAFNIRGSIQHDLSSDFAIGIDLRGHSALDYREFVGVAYVGYRFVSSAQLPREAAASVP